METAQAREQLATLPVRDFVPGEPVGVGALVELEGAEERAWYFLAPAAGGTEVVHAGREIYVLTPQSPLGGAVLGKRTGERINVGAGRAGQAYVVTAVL